MFKIITKLLYIISFVFSQNCYTQNDVFKNGLVSYQNKVYDIQNYIHPGGQRALLLSKGKQLEEFFNMNEYKFHINSQLVNKHLENIYVGNLYSNCNNITTNNTFNIFNDSHLLYLTITLSLLLSLFLFLLISNYSTKLNCFNKNINLYCLGYYSHDIFIFYLLYILWWLSLLILSFFSFDVLNRLGIWICLNISFTLLPVTRNSLLVTLLKISYNKLINIHKLIAVLCFLSVIIKSIVIIVLYNYSYLYKNISNIAGTICSLSIILTSIFAIPYIKKNIFELFYYSHKCFCILTIISLSFHYIICLYYITPSILLYLFDLIIRIFNTKKVIYSNVKIYDFKEYNTSYILLILSIEKHIKIIPGCYFFICCNKISKLQWHPLSLISESNNNLVFCVKNMGDNSWSNNLKYLENIKFDTNNIYLQGPYYHINFKEKYYKYNYEYVINIANGIGITPFISILKDINYNIENNKYKLKKVIFIWIIPEIMFLSPFIYNLQNLNNIEIQIFLTKSNMICNSEYENNIFNFCQIFYKKPNMFEHISLLIKNNNIQDMKKTCVLYCGSESLLKDVYSVTTHFGIEIFNETFN